MNIVPNIKTTAVIKDLKHKLNMSGEVGTNLTDVPSASLAPTPSFSTFTFNTIGQVPSLLSRISDQRADEIDSHSSAPTPTEDYIALPPDSEVDDASHSVPLDRQSLLQALTSAQDHPNAMDVDSDRSQHKELEGHDSVPSTPQLRYPSPDPELLPPLPLVLSVGRSPSSNLEGAVLTPTISAPSQSIRGSPGPGGSPSVVAPPTIPLPHIRKATALDNGPEVHKLERSFTDLLNLSTMSPLPLEPLASIVTALQHVETENSAILLVARRGHSLAQECLDSAKQILNASEETLRVAENSHSRLVEVFKQVEDLKEIAQSRNHSLRSLNDDISAIKEQVRKFIDSASNACLDPVATDEDGPPAATPLSAFESSHDISPSVSQAIIFGPLADPTQIVGSTKDRAMSVYDIYRLHCAPEAEADMARRAWEAERHQRASSPGSQDPVPRSLLGSVPSSSHVAGQPSQVSASSVANSTSKSPVLGRRSIRTIILSERARNEPELAHSILRERMPAQSDTAAPNDALPCPVPTPSTSLPSRVSNLSSHNQARPALVGNPIARSTVISASPRKSGKAASRLVISGGSAAPPVPPTSPPNLTLPNTSPFSSAPASASVQSKPNCLPSLAFAQPILPGPPSSSAAPDLNKESLDDPLPHSSCPVTREPSLPSIASLVIANDICSMDSSPPSPSSPLVYSTRQTSDTGNLPFVPPDPSISMTARFYNTKHLLQQHGQDWHRLAAEAALKQEEEENDMLRDSVLVEAVSTMAKIRNESITMAKKQFTTPSPQKQLISPPLTEPSPLPVLASITVPKYKSASPQKSPPGPRIIRPPPAMSATMHTSANGLAPPSDKPRPSPSASSLKGVAPTVATGPQRNGLPKERSIHPISILSGARPPPSTTENLSQSPVSTTQKRKFDDINSSGLQDRLTLSSAGNSKRSRPDARPPFRGHSGDHWSPPRRSPSPRPSPPPRHSAPTRRTPIVDRIGSEVVPSPRDSYRRSPDNDGYGSQNGYRGYSPPSYKSGRLFNDERDSYPGDMGPSDVPGLALRLSSSSQSPSTSVNRGRGRSRGGSAPRARRGSSYRAASRGRGGGLESRISDAPSTSLGDRLTL